MNQKKWDALWINGSIATCKAGYGLIENGAIAVSGDKITWVGRQSDLAGDPHMLAAQLYDMQGGCLTPGLIDCHTHLIYAGNRASEFEQRLQGMTYEEIALRGGGIMSTVAATRKASEEELFIQSIKRARTLLSNGVTTVEIKSGYGLDWETELKMLRVAKRIQDELSITVQKTFLGAHTIPPEYRGKADEYIEHVCNEMIPKIAAEQLAEAVDVFCEKIAFNLPQTERVFATAKKFNLAVKCHAEQLTDSGGSQLAAKYQAISVDHLEHVSNEGVQAIAQAGTVAVLLPGAFYFIHETKHPPVGSLRKHNIPIAIATDCNPGTSPVLSPLLIMNMACTLFRLTPEEALLGMTQNAAKALGLSQSHGTLEIGKAADFAIWDVKHPAELVYYMGCNPLLQLVTAGKLMPNFHSQWLFQ